MGNNILKILNSVLNNRGKVSPNVIAGLSVGVFAAIIGYGVYSAYNHSPAYNPAMRSIYTGENSNIDLGSLGSGNLELDSSSVLPVGASVYSKDDIFSAEYDQTQADKEAAKFRSAQAYLNAKKAGQTAATADTGKTLESSGGVSVGQTKAVQSVSKNSSIKEGQTVALSKAGRAANQEAQILQDVAAINKTKGFVRNSAKATAAKATQSSAYLGEVGESENTAAAKNINKQKNSVSNQDKDFSAMLAQTSINRLGTSEGSSFSGGSSGGSSARGGSGSNYGSSSVRSSKDTNTTPLPANRAVGKQADGNAFTMGRVGAEGGFQVATGDGGSVGESKGDRGSNAKRDLNVANFYSKQGAATIQSGGEKALAQGAMEAANAFDGGATITSGPTIDGSNPIDIGTHDLGLNIGNDLRGSLNDIKTDWQESDAEKRERLQGYVWMHMIYALLAAVVAFFAIQACVESGGFWGYAGAALFTLSALYAIWFADYDGDGTLIFGTISEVVKLREAQGMNGAGIAVAWYAILTVLTAGVALAWFSAKEASEAGAETEMSFIQQYMVGQATSKASNQIMGGVTQAINKQ